MVERWRQVELNIPEANGTTLEISSTGRLKIYNKNTPQGKIIKGALLSGYNILRLKFFRPRPAETTAKLALLKNEMKIASTDADAAWIKRQRDILCTQDFKDRSIHWHCLVHRLVAEYFLLRPSEQHTIVGHKNFNKLDNRKINLVWQTPEESYKHQQLNPMRVHKPPVNAKLTETKVMFIKKLLSEGKKAAPLAKTFKVSPTQICRIKKEENWKAVKAAV